MLRERLAIVRERMRYLGIDCLALVPGSNLKYLTNVDFFQLERPLIAFMPAEDAELAVLIPELEAPAWESEVAIPSLLFPWSDKEGPEGALRRLAKGIRPQSLAAEYLRMRLAESSLIRSVWNDIHIAQAEAILTPVRQIKDVRELEYIQQANTIAETSLMQVIETITIGMTEKEIGRRLTASLLMNGGETVPLEPLVQSGPNSARPHGRTTDRKLEPGDLLLIDYTTTVNGYFSDLTRTLFAGEEVPAKVAEVYGVVKAANAAAHAAARPGASCQDVDRAARKVIEDAGYGPFFLHRTGHGLGLDVHEHPVLIEGNDLALEEGMVFTIEPGIYLEGWGGVRIEDNVVISGEGCRSFTQMTRDLTPIGLRH